MVKAAREYQHQLALMNTAGMTQLEIVKATQAAWATTKSVPTSSAMENLQAIRELRMVFGNTGEAIENVGTVQKLQAILSTVKGVNAHDEAYTLAKALEMRGAVRNPAEFTVQADAMAKAMVASGGKVGAQDFLSAFKYGRSATVGWNDEFTYTILPTLIQEMKSRGGGGGTGGPGNALMSAYAEVVGGTISQKALKVWEKLGLVDPSKEVFTKTGALKGIQPGGIKGSDLFQQNPKAWVDQYLLPAFKSAGYTDDAKVREVLQYMFPNRTAGFVMSQLTTQGWKFERDQKLIGQAQGLGAYDQLLKTDPQMASLALQKQWQSLLAILGFQILPAVLKATLAVMHVLGDLGRLMERHRILASALVWSFAGLSAALLFGGSVILLTAAFTGLKAVLMITGFTRSVIMLGTGISQISAALGGTAVAGALTTLAGGISALATAAAPFIAALAAAGMVAGGAYTAFQAAKRLAAGDRPDAWDLEGNPIFTHSELASRIGESVRRSMEGLTVQMDGRTVGKVVGDSLGKAAADITSPQRFDPSMAPGYR